MLPSKSHIVQDAEALSHALRYEPTVYPNFEAAEIGETAKIMLAAMMNGLTDASLLHHYLKERGSKFERPTIEFLLHTFEGLDPDRDLWTKQPDGQYAPMFSEIPY